jgi:thiamine pyrophosphate-dependent acetolactate synthase large subunit-like protein
VLPNFNTTQNFRPITKWSERILVPEAAPEAMRRAFTQARNGRPGPSLIETPVDLMNEELAEPFNYEPTKRVRTAPDPQAVAEAAEALVAAKRPVIYAGQGIHYAKAWSQLKDFAELLEAPVCTSLAGKSAFPENHPLALGAGGPTFSKQLYQTMVNADLILGIGCSFSDTPFGITMPPGTPVIHATLDPMDVNKASATRMALLGDAALTLDALLEEVRDRLGGGPRGQIAQITGEIAKLKQEWLGEWTPHLTSKNAPLSPYRVIWDLLHTVDAANTVITHDSGSPRNQLTPFWEAPSPLGYIGWGKSTQLGYGLGLAMGAKIARPDQLCINLWGDAAIGFTGMDIETAAREQIPILSILLNNSTMAAEHKSMPVATEKYRSTDISGNYTEMAQALGLHSERVEKPEDIVPAIKRGVDKTKDGIPALLEFITEYSSPQSLPGVELSPHRKK